MTVTVRTAMPARSVWIVVTSGGPTGHINAGAVIVSATSGVFMDVKTVLARSQST
jgi:hypothetical protein